jgi:hypothetical protein
MKPNSRCLPFALLLISAVATAQDAEKKTIEPKHEQAIVIARLKNHQNQYVSRLKDLEVQAAPLQQEIVRLSAEITAAVKKAAKDKDVDLCVYAFDPEELVFVERTTEEQKKQARDAGLCKDEKKPDIKK